MKFTISCTALIGKGNRTWVTELEVLKCGDTCEAIVQGNGSWFHVIIGPQMLGNYVCIPNYHIGSELSSYDDLYWNWEQLRNYTKLGSMDAYTIAFAVRELGKMLA